MKRSLQFTFNLITVLFFAIAVRAQVVNNTPTPSAVTETVQQFEIGPTLDVVPYVLADGYTINLTLIPELLQFDGYDTPPTIPALNVENVVQLPIVLPHFTVREVATTVNVWDGQTVVLGGLISSSIANTKDKVPFLGDLPVVGRLFQAQSKVTQKKNLMIFVTAQIVDPAGNRVHSDDELPFNPPSSIPPQPPGAGQATETDMSATPTPVGAPVTIPVPAQ